MYNNCYGGNPKAFSDYVLKTYGDNYQIVWVFSRNVDFETDPSKGDKTKRIKVE
jgi:hypothetical protein